MKETMMTDAKQYAAQILKQYPNNAEAIFKNGVIVYIRYNTGDQVWFDDHHSSVTKIITHDGLILKDD